MSSENVVVSTLERQSPSNNEVKQLELTLGKF